MNSNERSASTFSFSLLRKNFKRSAGLPPIFTLTSIFKEDLMRTVTLLFAVVMLGVAAVWAQTGKVVKTIKPAKMDISAPLSQMVKKSQALSKARGQEREIPNILSSSTKQSSKRGQESGTPDPLLQQQPGVGTNAVTVALNFAGGSNNDNQAVVGGRVAPPDPNIDVGPNHIVQTINLITTIYNKSGGTVLGPFATSDFWDGFGGDCELNNDGDPIVLYDHLADRWVISQFVFSTDQCVCVSQTGDPTGAYYRYEFNTPGNDYPKMGVMEDAYYLTIRNFDGTFNMDAAAIDRAQMLVGGPATIQIFNLSALNPDVEGFIPADLDGPAPPAGTPGLIVGHNGGPTLVHDELEVYKMDVDFATPSNSSLSLASIVPVATFDLTVTTIPQPSTTIRLDALAQFTMHRATIRDFGSGQNFRMALTHTVDVGSNRAGVRWYEIRDNTRTGNSWTLYQQGTHSPDGTTHRWMPSIAMNANGDIGLSYTASSSSVFPSIRATGRLATDPLNTMQSEVTIVAGTGSQTGTGRWGDYSSLSVDPSNNTTFIGNHEYVITTGSFNWWTRIFSFDVSGSGGGGGWQTITYDDFESGMGSYTDGGADMSRYTGSTHAHQPVAAANIQDNSGAASSFYHTGSYNVSSYTSLEVNFWFKMVSMESGEDFWLQYSSNGGSTWQTVATFARGSTYANGTFYNAVVTLTPGTVTFSTNAKLRFICDASDNNDDVYIDEILFRGNTGSAALTKGDNALNAAAGTAPEDFQLYQNYPNPFNPSTRIRFELPQAMEVKLSIFNTLGEEVRTLVQRYYEAGSYEVEWDGRSAAGARAPSGMYIYRLEGDGLNLVRKMTLLQ